MHPDEKDNTVSDFLDEIIEQKKELALRIQSTETTISQFSEQLRQMKLEEIYLAGKEAMCNTFLEQGIKDEDTE